MRDTSTDTRKIVKVKRAFELITYSSFEATTFSVANDIKEMFRKVNKKVLTDYKFDGETLILTLDDEVHVVVRVGDNSITSEVTTKQPQICELIKEQPIFFEYNNNKEVIWEWDVPATLEKRKGGPIAFSPGEQFLFIFAKGYPDLKVSGYVSLDQDNRIFLDMCET